MHDTPTLPVSVPPAPVFRIEGALVVSNVETCRARMATWFATTGDTTIDLAAATQFDLFGLQLLWAARRSAAAAGNSFQLLNAPDAFTRACALAGIAPAAFAPLQTRHS